MLTLEVNMGMIPPPKNYQELEVTELEKKAQAGGARWRDTGTAYGQEHGTRTATIGLVLSSSPIAMLAWYQPYLYLNPLHIADMRTP